MKTTTRSCVAVLTLVAALFPSTALCQAPANRDAPAPPPARLFAVEFRTGPGWDPAKPPGEQLHFADHSANLRKLREEGRIVLGARYGEVGLVIITADSEVKVREVIDADPAVRAGTFVYELHPMSVFYPGCVDPRKP